MDVIWLQNVDRQDKGGKIKEARCVIQSGRTTCVFMLPGRRALFKTEEAMEMIP